MDKNREVPEGVLDWIKSSMSRAPLYYRKSGKGVEIICGHCGFAYYHEFARKEPRPKKDGTGVCLECGHRGRYAWMKETLPKWEHRKFYYFDKTEENDIFVRYFAVEKVVRQYSPEKMIILENRRLLCKPGHVETWRIDTFWNGGVWNKYWEKNSKVSVRGIESGEIYPGYEKTIATSTIPYFKPDDYLNYQFKHNGAYIAASALAYAACPPIELMAKFGLEELVEHLITSAGSCGLINRRAKKMKSVLKLSDKKHIDELIKHKGNLMRMRLLQMDEKGEMKTDEWARDTISRTHALESFKTCLKYMSCEQLRNRAEQYKSQFDTGKTFKSESSVIIEYADYLRLREKLGYDMTNSVYIHPRSLYAAHQKMIAENRARQDELFVAKKNKEFENIPKRFEKVRKKYEYQKEGLCIVIPRSAGDIIKEGRELHHCVGTDTYLSRHNKGISNIIFLRSAQDPNTPYATIEIAGTDIRQWYEAHDKKPHAEIIEPWLKDYINHLKGESCS